jgi:hypothetical protein
VDTRTHLFLWPALLLLTCYSIARTSTSTVIAQGAVLWSADHEEGSEVKWYEPGGFNQGGGEFDNGCAGTAPSSDQNHTPNGMFSLALTIGAPCGRASQSGTRMFRWQESHQYADLYYKVWYYFPQIYQRIDPLAGFWNVWQWKSKTASQNDSFFQINIGNRSEYPPPPEGIADWLSRRRLLDIPPNPMFLYLYNWQSRMDYPQASEIDIPINEWFSVEAYYSSREDNSGRVTVWQNGVLLTDVQNVQTRYVGGVTEWSVNSYSDGGVPSPVMFYIDDVEIRTP